MKLRTAGIWYSLTFVNYVDVRHDLSFVVCLKYLPLKICKSCFRTDPSKKKKVHPVTRHDGIEEE